MIRTFKALSLATAVSITLLSSAYAAESNNKQLTYNLYSFTVQESEKIENDQMQVVFTIESTQKDATRAAKTVNDNTQWALTQLKNVENVQYQTISYTTRPLYKEEEINQWQVSQTLQLTGKDFTQLSTLVSTLQKKLMFTVITFSASPAVKDKVNDTLITKTLECFKARAKQIQTTMNAKSYKVVYTHINADDGMRPQPMEGMMLMAKSNAGVGLESGHSTVSVSVSGQIQLVTP